MQTFRYTLTFGLAAIVALALAGCNPANPVAKAPKVGDAHDHEHDHAHHGPHHGHIMAIGEEEYHAEWTHDESGKVTFYILDADVKKDVPIAADQIVIDVKVGDHEPNTFKLAAVNPMDGKSSTFEIVDKGLVGALETIKSPGVVATLKLNINGKEFAQKIEEHHHH